MLNERKTEKKHDGYVDEHEIDACYEAIREIHDERAGQGYKYHIESYGCQMNDHDSEKLAGILKGCGYAEATSIKEADIIMFNTCCVREHAELRVFGNIGALKKYKDEKPGVIIGVCGCMMQQREVAQKLYKRFPYVDIVFGTEEIYRFPLYLKSAMTGSRIISVRDREGLIAEDLPVIRRGGISANVIIMYGCNNFCSYCIVPYVRGRERSRMQEDIIAEARRLVNEGYKEITFLGQNVNSYMSADGKTDFPELLRQLNDCIDIPRIRFMTSHPKDLSHRLIDSIASLNKVCKHIHLPVQSGSDRILKEMNRKYDRGQYLRSIEELRRKVPDIEITTDIIVGFPGETDDDFNDTLSLVKEAGFSAAYTFMYSPRTGTKAASHKEQIPQAVKKQRLMELNRLQAALISEQLKGYKGKTGEVLVEGVEEKGQKFLFGKLSNFRMVYFPGERELIGQFVPVRITGIKSNSLCGELII